MKLSKTGITLVAAFFLFGAVSAPLPAPAQTPLPDQAEKEAERARDAIEEAVGRLIAGLKLVIDSIPQYEAPVVLENGDILIRRKKPDDREAEPNQDI